MTVNISFCTSIEHCITTESHFAPTVLDKKNEFLGPRWFGRTWGQAQRIGEIHEKSELGLEEGQVQETVHLQPLWPCACERLGDANALRSAYNSEASKFLHLVSNSVSGPGLTLMQPSRCSISIYRGRHHADSLSPCWHLPNHQGKQAHRRCRHTKGHCDGQRELHHPRREGSRSFC